MIINVASFGGRSHLLNTAAELAKNGHIVRFYSYVPTKRAVKFGLPKECSYSIFYYALPFLLIFKLFGFKEWAQSLYWHAFDYFLAFHMKKCDVFIGQLPMHKYCMQRMKRKYNALTILESGISNIDNYIKILESIESENIPHINIQRYRDEYEIADYISVASLFAKESFESRITDTDKIFVNPYGVDLQHFHPTTLDEKEQYDCLVVGQWSKRKGSHIVTETCRNNNLSLLHVGTIVDVDFPKETNFKHHDAVDEAELINYYSKARVLLFPSYEDGFGLVLCQALACGLPIVCSKNCGGPTLKKMLDDTPFITVMEEISHECLSKAVEIALHTAKEQKGTRSYGKNFNDMLSWEAYGMRYNSFLRKITQQKKTTAGQQKLTL